MNWKNNLKSLAYGMRAGFMMMKEMVEDNKWMIIPAAFEIIFIPVKLVIVACLMPFKWFQNSKLMQAGKEIVEEYGD